MLWPRARVCVFAVNNNNGGNVAEHARVHVQREEYAAIVAGLALSRAEQERLESSLLGLLASVDKALRLHRRRQRERPAHLHGNTAGKSPEPQQSQSQPEFRRRGRGAGGGKR